LAHRFQPLSRKSEISWSACESLASKIAALGGGWDTSQLPARQAPKKTEFSTSRLSSGNSPDRAWRDGLEAYPTLNASAPSARGAWKTLQDSPGTSLNAPKSNVG